MAFIYENDVTRLGGNLQTTVAYLLSLHKAEYEWNLLGIKVVGVKEELPIPDGDYEYGDAYMIGNKTDGFEMWIYTRADEYHSEAYWFDVGQFPKPGPQGPKGDGFETVVNWNTGTVQSVTYDTNTGAAFESTAVILYKDSTTGETKYKEFPCVIKLPLIPGKYLSMDANSDGDALEVKVDDTELALDFYKINKTSVASVPTYSPTKGRTDTRLSFHDNENALVVRGNNGEAKFNWILANQWKKWGSEDTLNFSDVASQLIYGACVVNKKASDTGTIPSYGLEYLKKFPQYQIQYDNQTYYRMDPLNAPDGTLNYIHIDSVQDSGKYKATGKCFSITVSTRSWQVVDLVFQASVGTIYRHHITYSFNITGTQYEAHIDWFTGSDVAMDYETVKAKLSLFAPANVTFYRPDNNATGSGVLLSGTALKLVGNCGDQSINLTIGTPSAQNWNDEVITMNN